MEADVTEAWLASSKWIDADHPRVLACATQLRSVTPQQTARATFLFVRDEIAHSCDIATSAMPLAASDVLEAGTGLCYAKSHLLAALLRANQIPSALGYVRLRDGGSGYCLHGFNYLSLDAVIRVDARGNNVNVQTAFEAESLAYWPEADGERFLERAFTEPLAAVVEAYARARSLPELLAALPDAH